MSRDNRRIATLWDDKESDDHHEHDHSSREGQAFYAGGSEHSGQQILGPSRDSANPDQFIQNIFNHARSTAAALTDPNDPAVANPTENTLPITFWRNGFTIGEDTQLRDYADNREFLEYIKRGETPPEIASRVRSGPVDVRMEYKVSQDYKPERKLQAFSGEGHRLGAPVPETVASCSSTKESVSSQDNQAASNLVVDESIPVVTVQVRLSDNTRLAIRTNRVHTIGDLVAYIRALRPQYSNTDFVLATTFPAKELVNLEQSIEDAKIANTLLSQKIKRL